MRISRAMLLLRTNVRYYFKTLVGIALQGISCLQNTFYMITSELYKQHSF